MLLCFVSQLEETRHDQWVEFSVKHYLKQSHQPPCMEATTLHDARGVNAQGREPACYTKSKVEAGWTPQLGWLLCPSLLLRGTGLLLNKHFCRGKVTCSA